MSLNKVVEFLNANPVQYLDTGWFKTDWLCEWKFNEERFPVI